MSDYWHKGLAEGAWQNYSLIEQLANAGSEAIRSLKWRGRNEECAVRAAERALELLSLTIDDPKNRARLGELTRLYEVVVDELYGFNEYGGEVSIEKYFLQMTFAASLIRARRPGKNRSVSDD